MMKGSHGSLLGVFRCPYARTAMLTTLAAVVFSTLAFKRLRSGSSTKTDKEGKHELKNQSIQTEDGKDDKTMNADLSESKYRVVFVLGGPGSGKGTQCDRVISKFPWVHLSAGDLLRAERKKSGSEIADVINARIAAGQLVPSDITVRLLRTAMEKEKSRSGKTNFVIDGFPRSEENVTAWDDQFGQEGGCATVEFVLFLDCPEEVMTSRLLERSQTSGRSDDNLETIRKRLETDRKESMPVVDMYEQRGRLRKIPADRSIDDVFSDVSNLFEGMK